MPYGQERTSKNAITALNAYLPRLDQPGILQFIQRNVDDWRHGLPEVQEKGFLLDLTPGDVERCDWVREELNVDLQEDALFELQIAGNNGTLTPLTLAIP